MRILIAYRPSGKCARLTFNSHIIKNFRRRTIHLSHGISLPNNITDASPPCGPVDKSPASQVGGSGFEAGNQHDVGPVILSQLATGPGEGRPLQTREDRAAAHLPAVLHWIDCCQMFTAHVMVSKPDMCMDPGKGLDVESITQVLISDQMG